MTLRQKIVLLGIVAIVGTMFALWRQTQSYAAELQAIDQLRHNVGLVKSLSLTVHEMQKERGLSTIGGLGVEGPSLAAQIRATDKVVDGLAATGGDVSALRGGLRRLRAAVGASAISSLAARDAYTILVQALIDEMDRLSSGSAASIGEQDLRAHGHLVAAKEYLGLIRATLGFWIAHPKQSPLAFQSMARLKGLYDEQLRKFRRDAAPEVKEAFAAQEAAPAFGQVDRTLALIDITGRPPAGLDAAQWWTVATSAVDRLKTVEDRSLQHIDGAAEHKLAVLRHDMHVEAAVAAASGFAILFLAASATISLLRALSRALESLDQISLSKDFSRRIPVGSADEIGRISRSFNELLDVAERLLKEKDYLAHTDPLTGTNNRLRFTRALREELIRRRRHEIDMALVIFDVDHFKKINDTWGHQTGDDVLKTLVHLVGGNIRQSDFLGRWGGEEFVLLLRDDDCDGAIRMAEKLRALIAAADFPGAASVTCSFGVSGWQRGDTGETLLERADRALYAAKRGGRNQVRCDREFPPVMEPQPCPA